MAQIIKVLKIDLSQESSYVYLKVKEGDDLSRKYQVVFTDRGIPIDTLDGSELITLWLAESGSTVAYANQDCTWEDGIPYITFTANMLSVVGDIDACFVIYDAHDNSVISSRIWHLNVQRSLIDYNGLIKSEDFDVLNNLIKQALMIPELLEEFEEHDAEIEEILAKIKAEIEDWESQWNELSMDIREFIMAILYFLDECEDAVKAAQNATEETIAATEDTIAATNAAISATEDTVAATEAANEASEEAWKQALYAEEQGDLVKAALEDLEYAIIDCDGGYAPTEDYEYDTDFDGGNAA